MSRAGSRERKQKMFRGKELGPEKDLVKFLPQGGEGTTHWTGTDWGWKGKRLGKKKDRTIGRIGGQISWVYLVGEGGGGGLNWGSHAVRCAN